MSLEQALAILEQAAALALLNRADRIAVEQAVAVLRQFIAEQRKVPDTKAG